MQIAEASKNCTKAEIEGPDGIRPEQEPESLELFFQGPKAIAESELGAAHKLHAQTVIVPNQSRATLESREPRKSSCPSPVWMW